MQNSIVQGSLDGTDSANVKPVVDVVVDQQAGRSLADLSVANLVGMTQALNNAFINGSAMTKDAQLNPLANNGGPTQTRLPQPGSPAIGGGQASTCAMPPVSGVDQRGLLRSPTRCSIGAVEAEPYTPPPDMAGSLPADLAAPPSADGGNTSGSMPTGCSCDTTQHHPAGSLHSLGYLVLAALGLWRRKRSRMLRSA
jgi:MYXO-CTERM domain-containing protein